MPGSGSWLRQQKLLSTAGAHFSPCKEGQDVGRVLGDSCRREQAEVTRKVPGSVSSFLDVPSLCCPKLNLPCSQRQYHLNRSTLPSMSVVFVSMPSLSEDVSTVAGGVSGSLSGLQPPEQLLSHMVTQLFGVSVAPVAIFARYLSSCEFYQRCLQLCLH